MFTSIKVFTNESVFINLSQFSLTFPEAKALILWSTDAKNGLIGKDPDAGQN